MIKNISGSTRRLIAFLAALLVVALSGPLDLDVGKLGVVAALTAGYIGQGAAREALRRKP